jgi:hypothetical protein
MSKRAMTPAKTPLGEDFGATIAKRIDLAHTGEVQRSIAGCTARQVESIPPIYGAKNSAARGVCPRRVRVDDQDLSAFDVQVQRRLINRG